MGGGDGGGESSRGGALRSSSATRGLGMKNRSGGGGEIVEVQGGHIVRSIGRKDRHSKVCTSKGPRDRRVRLAAHTAIQFYDVQDRLGYDRPSKAVDWLIKKAKAAIDELDQLPSWHPTTANTAAATKIEEEAAQKKPDVEEEERAAAMAVLGGGQQDEHRQRREDLNESANFLPPSLDSDSIADTIKSFFPMGGGAASAEPSASFQRFSIPGLLPRTSIITHSESQNQSQNQSQDLRLSLQSLQDPILLQQQQAHQNHHLPASQVLLSGTPIASFDAAAALWPEHHHSPELNRFQKLQSWNNPGGGDGGNASDVGLYNNPTQSTASYHHHNQHQHHLHPQHHHHHHNQLFPQRGPLQSSNMPSFRAWIDYPPSISLADYYNPQQQLHQINSASAVSGPGFYQPGISGFSGFHVPARIQGDEEEHHDGYSDKPSSASSDSRH